MKIVQISKPNLTELSVAIRLRTDRRNTFCGDKHQEYENSTGKGAIMKEFTHFVGTNIKNMKIVKVKPNLTEQSVAIRYEFTHFVGTNIKNMKIVQISMKVKPNLTELSVAIRLQTDRRNNGNLHILWGQTSRI